MAEYTDVEITHLPSVTDRIQHQGTQNKRTELLVISVATAAAELSFIEYKM
jgi:hypothetical protein